MGIGREALRRGAAVAILLCAALVCGAQHAWAAAGAAELEAGQVGTCESLITDWKIKEDAVAFSSPYESFDDTWTLIYATDVHGYGSWWAGSHKVKSWTTSDKDLATVRPDPIYDDRAIVSMNTNAKKSGTAVITATDYEGQKRTCEVTVTWKKSDHLVKAAIVLPTIPYQTSPDSADIRIKASEKVKETAFYELYCAKGKGKFRKILWGYFDDNGISGQTDQIRVPLEDLKQNTRYRFKARISIDGELTWGPFSKAVTYHTSFKSISAKKAKVKVGNGRRATWKQVRGAKAYLVEYSSCDRIGYNIFFQPVYRVCNYKKAVKKNGMKLPKGCDISRITPIGKHGKRWYYDLYASKRLRDFNYFESHKFV